MQAHNNLGILLYNLKRYEEAEEEFREAARINPGLAESHHNLGLLLENLKRYGEAEAEFREAAKINPGFAEVREAVMSDPNLIWADHNLEIIDEGVMTKNRPLNI